MRTYYGCCLTEDHKNLDDCLCYESELESVLSLIFRHYDYSFSLGKNSENGSYYVCERVENAIERELSQLTVTLFRVECANIMPSGVNWTEGMYLRNTVNKYDHGKKAVLCEYLMTSVDSGTLNIYRYPARPLNVPLDDHDLVERAIIQYHMYGPSALAKISRHHPDLMDKVLKGIEMGLYKEYGI